MVIIGGGRGCIVLFFAAADMLKTVAKELGLHRWKRLYNVYHKYFCRNPHPLNMPDEDVVLEMNGQRIWAADPKKSFIGRSIFYHGVWEKEATQFVCPRVREGMTVVDVGARTGYYTLLFAKRVGRQVA
jgi:hypothetical protein